MKRKQYLSIGIISIAIIVVVAFLLSRQDGEKVNTNNKLEGESDIISEGSSIDYLEEIEVDLTQWSLYSLSNTSVKGHEDDKVVLDIDSEGTSEDDIQLIYKERINLLAGRYELTLPIKTTVDRKVRLVLEKYDKARTSIYDQELILHKGDNAIKVPVEVQNGNMKAIFSVRLGHFNGDDNEAHQVEIDKLKLELVKQAEIVNQNDHTKIDEPDNMIVNWDLSKGVESFGIYNMLDGAATISEEDETLKVHATNSGTQGYSIQVFQDGIKLYTGNKYKVSFKYKANIEKIFEFRIQLNGGNYRAYVSNDELIFNSEWQTYEQEFVMEDASDEAARFQLNLGQKGDATAINEEMYFDDFNLVMLEGKIPVVEESNPIRINQVGYRNNDPKVAFVVSGDRTFKVFTEDHQLVLTKNLELKTKDVAGKEMVDISSGDVLRSADFTNLTADGKYYLKVRKNKSSVFEISENVYDELTNATMKFFYYQRCGGDGIDAAYVGEAFAHGPCHIGLAKYYDPNDSVYGNIEVDVSGGWHDAGDYGRYVTPGAKSVADLLLTLEHFPEMGTFDYGSPNRLLEETRYEIEWMLKMQNPETGGVYHKVTALDHPAMNLAPEADHNQLYLSPVSPQAAGDFAAIMAYANRMYKKEDSQFAATCLEAAEKAWKWLEDNKNENTHDDPSFFHTGPYGDQNAMDERYWAATELYKTTGDEKYHNYILNNDLPKAGFGWADMGSYALVAYLTTDSVDKESELYLAMKERFIQDANQLIDTWANDGYNLVLNDYVWGSNKDLSDKTMLLIIANRLEPNPEYEEAVLDQFNYILGRNAMDISYITDIGGKSAINPHHRPSVVANEVVPGMLVGGPNGKIMNELYDPVSKMVNSETPPAKCYADVVASYATNEICIYWNSPVVYIVGYLNSK